MKIYSKKGDSGNTSLIDGEIVNKHNLSVDAYGTIDELNSFLGLLKDYIKDDKIKDKRAVPQYTEAVLQCSHCPHCSPS